MEIISKSSMGELVISDEVLSSIAVNAAKDVDGVSSFCNKPVDVVNTIKQGSLKVIAISFTILSNSLHFAITSKESNFIVSGWEVPLYFETFAFRNGRINDNTETYNPTIPITTEVKRKIPSPPRNMSDLIV